MKGCFPMTLAQSRFAPLSWLVAGIVAIVATSVPASRASAAVIAGWDFNGLTNGGTTPFSASSSDAAVTVTGLTRTLPSGQNTGANTWGSNALTAQTQANAVNFGQYFSFSITSTTSGVSLSDIAAYNVWIFEQNPSSVPTNDFFGVWQYRTNSNAFADIGSSAQLGSISQGAGNPQSALSLSGLSDLQSMPAGTQADFRFVVWGAGYGANYAGFNSFQSGNDLIVNGTVPVPEPATSVMALTGLGCAGSLVVRRRRAR
jgi:hypothetical protein